MAELVIVKVSVDGRGRVTFDPDGPIVRQGDHLQWKCDDAAHTGIFSLPAPTDNDTWKGKKGKASQPALTVTASIGRFEYRVDLDTGPHGHSHVDVQPTGR